MQQTGPWTGCYRWREPSRGSAKAEDFTVLGGIKKQLVVDFYVGQLGHQSLTCHFSKKNHAQLARLSKGQYIAVEGVCKGAEFGNVSLQDCRIISR